MQFHYTVRNRNSKEWESPLTVVKCALDDFVCGTISVCFYDYLHEKMYDYHVLQADETPVLVSKENRTSGSRHYMWYIVPVRCIRTNQSYCMNINPLEMQIIQEYS